MFTYEKKKTSKERIIIMNYICISLLLRVTEGIPNSSDLESQNYKYYGFLPYVALLFIILSTQVTMRLMISHWIIAFFILVALLYFQEDSTPASIIISTNSVLLRKHPRYKLDEFDIAGVNLYHLVISSMSSLFVVLLHRFIPKILV